MSEYEQRVEFRPGYNYPRTDCQYLPGRTCHYDGSGLRADGLLRRFLTDGEDIVWATLREEYDLRATEAAETAAILSPGVTDA